MLFIMLHEQQLGYVESTLGLPFDNVTEANACYVNAEGF